MSMVFWRRTIEKSLSEGRGKQLSWVIMLIICVLILLSIISWWVIGLKWQDILSLFISAGSMSGPAKQDYFRIVVAIVRILLLSALLTPIMVGIVSNLMGAYRRGDARYKFSNHILIIGASHHLKNILLAIKREVEYNDKQVLVMTMSDVENLRNKMIMQIADKGLSGRITYYHCERQSLNSLKSACANKAFAIYIIGDEGESAHDALSLRCLNQLKELCGNEGKTIPCYVIMEMHSTLSVYNYVKGSNQSRLNIEMLTDADYAAEQLMVNTEYLPAFGMDDDCRLHIVIAGCSTVSQAFVKVAAQLCHYPNYHHGRYRTRLSLIGFGREEMYRFIADYSSLFELCHYRFVGKNTTEEYRPKDGYGDFMDLEWEFIEEQILSPSVRESLDSWVADPTEVTIITVCFDDDDTNAYTALHLPKSVYETGTHVAVYQSEYAELLNEAMKTGMYGNVFMFGEASQNSDALFINRSLMGKRVNRVYDIQYGTPPAKDEDEAWYRLTFAHKQSSIACANSIPLKLRSFNIKPTREDIDKLSETDIDSLSEVEHRRWMATQLLMGYTAASAEKRKDRSHFKYLKDEKFVHLDIAPYEELGNEAAKDLLIIKNIPYIVTGVK